MFYENTWYIFLLIVISLMGHRTRPIELYNFILVCLLVTKNLYD